ncbi:MAG: hypothetical protein ACKOBR_04780, partial [Actinomycetota bacterium]
MENIELAYLSGTEQLRLFAARSISPVEVLQAQISRAEVLEPKVNAFSHLRDAGFEERKITALLT